MMNKYKRIILSCSVLLMAWLFMFNASGPGGGYTAAPFDGNNYCNNCHFSTSLGTSITMQLYSGATPVATYLPGGAYTLRITINGSGGNGFGFQTTAAFQGSNTDISTWGTLPPNTHSVTAGSHTYIEHTSPLASNIINIPWTAPASTSTVVFYAAGNRVFVNGNPADDHPNFSSLVVNSGCSPITLSPGTLPNGTVGTSYSQTVSQSGATGTPVWSVSTGSLPGGLSLNTSNGQITGIPTSTGTFNFTITVTGGNGCLGSQAYSVTISCPTVTVSPSTLGTMTVGTGFSQAFSQTGATGTITWSSTGTLPPGLVLNGSGVLSGTPTTTGNYTFTITATGNGPCSASQTFTNQPVGCPTVTVSPATIPTMVVGTAINQQYTQTGGVGTITWSATGLPPGVTLSGTGLLSGTPTTTGNYNIVITATGSGPCGGSQTFNNTPVTCPTITVNPATLGTMTVGTPFSQVFSQTGATGTVTWSFSGTLPPGLTLSGNTLSGTPTTTGNYTFTITATGNGPCSGSRTFTNQPVVCPTITVTPGTLGTMTVGTAFSQTFAQTGGSGTLTWSSTGTLPPGLTLSGNTLSGTPTVSGTYTFTITVTGNGPCSGSVTFTNQPVVCPAITVSPGTLGNIIVGSIYSQTFTQNGGTGFTWSSTGTLPPGLTLNPTTGILSGTPNTTGSYTFTITATNSVSGCSGSHTYTISVNCPTMSLSPGTVPNAPIGQTYSQTITQTGGTGPITWSTTGTLPPGITLSTGGVLSGTPTVAGSYTFTVVATDTYGCTASTSYTIVVACPTISLSPSTLPPGNVGFAYSQTITVTGSTNTFTFAATGTLPPGVTLNTTTGVLSGTPTTAGSYTFTITATDSYGCTTSTSYTLVISPCTPLVISPSTLPNGTVNTAYSQNMTQTGGTGTITWSSTGTLPPGVTLNPTTGVLSGTPTATGTYTFTIIATDVTTCSGTQSYTVNINCPTITLSPGTLPNAEVGVAYNQTFTQSGSTGTTFTYTVTAGTLPAGLTLDANTGVISGTTTVTGSSTFDITVTDEFGCSATMTYTLNSVCPAVTIDQTTVPTVFNNTPYNEQLTITGGTSPYTYAVTTGTLPAGITLDANTGLLSGTSTDIGTFTVTITVTDANGCTGTQTLTITVEYSLSVSSVTSGKESVALLPNLVTGKTTAQVISNYAGKAQVRIMDITGKIVYEEVTTLQRGENKIGLDLSNLAGGTYTLHIKPLNVKPVKFTKQ